MNEAQPQRETIESTGEYHDLADMHRFLKENNATGLLIGGRLFALARGATPQELTARKDADILLLQRGDVSYSDEYDIFAVNPRTGTVENQNNFVPPYYIHYHGQEKLKHGLYIPPLEATQLLLAEQSDRRPPEKSLALEQPLVYHTNQFPVNVNTIDKGDILIEFPGDISWLQKESHGKNLPQFRIFTNEMGNNFVSLSDKEISINELPQTVFRDTRSIIRPERNELDKDIFPLPNREDIRVTAKILLAEGHIQKALERLAEVDPSELDSDYILKALLEKKDYPYSCALGLSRWMRIAIDNKFVQLLKFYDLNNDQEKELQNLKEVVEEMRLRLIQQNGATYLLMAERLSAFIRTFPEQQLPPLGKILQHHISSLELKQEDDSDKMMHDCTIRYKQANGTTVYIIDIRNPISHPSKDGDVFLQTCLKIDASEGLPTISKQLIELYHAVPDAILMENFFDPIYKESNQKIIKMFNIKAEPLFPRLLDNLSIYNELCFAQLINFLISFEHTNVLPSLKTWFASQLENQTVLKFIQSMFSDKYKYKKQRLIDGEKFFKMLGMNYKDILKKQISVNGKSEKT